MRVNAVLRRTGRLEDLKKSFASRAMSTNACIPYVAYYCPLLLFIVVVAVVIVFSTTIVLIQVSVPVIARENRKACDDGGWIRSGS